MQRMTLYGPFSQILPMHDLALHGSISDDEISIIRDGGIVVDGDQILEVGSYSELAKKYEFANRALNTDAETIAVPAFIDCHTHICWAGNRANDYALRVAGKSYLEIAAYGGGIMDTVRATREASEDELEDAILSHANELLKQGIGIVEVKSGYGLNKDAELKMLRAIKSANQQTQVELIPTFLGAHIKPKDFQGNHLEYLNMLLADVVPIIQKEELSTRADIFVEEGAFGLEETSIYSKELMGLGFDMTMHADQFHAGGGKLANELGCVSADHLEFSDDETVEKFRDSSTVAVALPGASLGLGMQYTPCRKLLDQNACVAIATDWNPGSAPMGDLLTQASLLGASEKLSISETLAGITFRAARALRLDAGKIEKGSVARFSVFKTDDHRNIFYNQGRLRPSHTVLRNECIKH